MLIMKHFNKKMLLICPILKARAENFGKKIVGDLEELKSRKLLLRFPNV